MKGDSACPPLGRGTGVSRLRDSGRCASRLRYCALRPTVYLHLTPSLRARATSCRRICPTVSLRRARLAIALPASLPVTVVREPRIRKKKKERKKHGPESRVRWNEAHRQCIVVRNVEGGGPVRPRDSVYIASSRWRATARGPKCNVVPRHATDPYARGA